jgi:DNA invertase Pin-like site-specific DNA recombinase
MHSRELAARRFFTDTTSGSKSERPGLQDAMNHLRAGDTLAVWHLDRLGRTLKHLIATITDLSDRGIGFKSLQEDMDTMTSGGKRTFHLFAALAAFEREVSKERTSARLQAARARGSIGGRLSIQSRDPKKIALARKLHDVRSMPVKEICATLHIRRSTLYRHLKHEKSAGDTSQQL